MLRNVMALSPTARRLIRALGLVAGFLLCVAFLTLVARHTRYGNSDNANALLAGDAMLRGNPFLRDWVLPHNSYWLVDLPIFGIAGLLFGVREVLLHAVPATVTALTMFLAAVATATGRAVGRWWVGAGVVFVLLGLPHVYLVHNLLQGPHHLATALFCLATFLLLSGARLGSLRWAAATGLLAITVRSDPMAVAVGVVPVAAAGLIDGLRTRRGRSSGGPLLAAAAAMVGSLLLGVLLDVMDGYTHRSDDPPSVTTWVANLRASPTILGRLLGVFRPGGLDGVAEAAHSIGALAFAAALAATLVQLGVGLIRPRPRADDGNGDRPRRSNWPALDDMLLLGLAGSVAAFTLLSRPERQALDGRYLLPALVFGVVLTARRVTEVSAGLPAWVIAAVLLLGAGVYSTTPLAWVRRPAPANPSVAVVRWLETRNLAQGYGQYWVAGITTVTGRDVVRVRPVAAVDGKLQANPDFGSRRWFTDGRPFRFVIVDPAKPNGVDESVAAATFGDPAEVHDIGPFRVLVWNRDLTVFVGQ